MIKPKVKRCPFCCSENVHLAAQEGENGEDIVFIHCKDCDACGPSVESGVNECQEAVDLWNTRWKKANELEEKTKTPTKQQIEKIKCSNLKIGMYMSKKNIISVISMWENLRKEDIGDKQ